MILKRVLHCPIRSGHKGREGGTVLVGQTADRDADAVLVVTDDTIELDIMIYNPEAFGKTEEEIIQQLQTRKIVSQILKQAQ